MKKQLVKVVTSLTLMGGVFVGANSVSANTNETPPVGPDIILTFNDLPKDHWAYEEITSLVYHRIMYGYGNGKFGVGDNVTREQAAAVLYRALGLKQRADLENPYEDIDGSSTMFPYEILQLTDLGIFKGDENGKFRPKAPLTRAEMAQILTRTFEFEVKQKHTFTDVPEDFWAKDAISALQSNNVVVGTGDGKYEPQMFVTRDQYAKFLYNALLSYYSQDEVTKQ